MGQGYVFFTEEESKHDSWTLTSCDFCSEYRASLASSENVWGDCAAHAKLQIVWRSSLCALFSFSCNMKFHKKHQISSFLVVGGAAVMVLWLLPKPPLSPAPPFLILLKRLQASQTAGWNKSSQTDLRHSLVLETLFASGIHPAPPLMALSGLGGGKLNSLGKRLVYIRFKQVLMSDVSWEPDFLIFCRLQQKHIDYCGKFGCYLQHSGCYCEVVGYYHHHCQPWCLGILSKSILTKGSAVVWILLSGSKLQRLASSKGIFP